MTVDTDKVLVRFTVPDELRDYVLSDYKCEHAPDPEPEEAEDLTPYVDALVGSVRQRVADALGSDDADEPHFDAEASGDDGVLALEAGDVEELDDDEGDGWHSGAAQPSHSDSAIMAI